MFNSNTAYPYNILWMEAKFSHKATPTLPPKWKRNKKNSK